MHLYEFIVERPDGSSFHQEQEGETFQDAKARLRKWLGKAYYICTGWLVK